MQPETLTHTCLQERLQRYTRSYDGAPATVHIMRRSTRTSGGRVCGPDTDANKQQPQLRAASLSEMPHPTSCAGGLASAWLNGWPALRARTDTHQSTHIRLCGTSPAQIRLGEEAQDLIPGQDRGVNGACCRGMAAGETHALPCAALRPASVARHNVLMQTGAHFSPGPALPLAQRCRTRSATPPATPPACLLCLLATTPMS